MVSVSTCLWRLLFLQYYRSLTMLHNILFWFRCIISILSFLVQPHRCHISKCVWEFGSGKVLCFKFIEWNFVQASSTFFKFWYLILLFSFPGILLVLTYSICMLVSFRSKIKMAFNSSLFSPVVNFNFLNPNWRFGIMCFYSTG